MDKRIRQTIEDVLKLRPEITSDEVVEIVKIYAEKPDPVKLEEQYYRRVANRILSSFRDDEKVRNCFNITNNEGKHLYINVAQTTDADQLQQAKLSLAAKYRGLNKSIKKIQARELELAGQMAFDVEGNIINE